jgi:hypothetical protein
MFTAATTTTTTTIIIQLFLPFFFVFPKVLLLCVSPLTHVYLPSHGSFI